MLNILYVLKFVRIHSFLSVAAYLPFCLFVLPLINIMSVSESRCSYNVGLKPKQ